MCHTDQTPMRALSWIKVRELGIVCDGMSLLDATLHYESLPIYCAEMMFEEQRKSPVHANIMDIVNTSCGHFSMHNLLVICTQTLQRDTSPEDGASKHFGCYC
jgi:hypothetical protein